MANKAKLSQTPTPQSSVLVGKKRRKQKTPLARTSIKEVKKKPKEELNKNRKTHRLMLDRGSPTGEEDNLWNCNTSPWSDPYEVVTSSRTTEQLKALVQLKLAQVKADATSMGKSSLSVQELRQPKCVVVDVQKQRKGVVTESTIEPGTLVMQYKGKYTLRHLVSAELSVPGVSLWKERPCPFLYYYDKIPGIDLVVDARHHGNIARFIRRSCSPNCELQHILVNESDLVLALYSMQPISSGEEVTLPFDFQFSNCDYQVECACGQRSCLLEKGVNDKGASKKKLSERDSAGRLSGDTPLHTRKRRRTTSSLNSPVVSTPTAPSEEVEGDEGDSERSSKKKSREERKLEQYVKMFNSMEASTRRRQDKKEDDMDITRNSRKRSVRPPLLSVDDNASNDRTYDAISPGESELTSPLYSIGLVMSPTLHLSPPPSPPPRPKPKIEFEVGPYTDPGYLFNSFPSTCKKILLARWMSHSRYSDVSIGQNQDQTVDTVPLKKKLLRRFYQEEVTSGNADISTLPVKMRTAMKWRIQRSAQLPTGEDCGGGRQSPLFEDFSDDEDFDCLSDVKSLSREHRLSSGSTSLPPGPKTPNTPPSSSPRRGNWLSSPLNMSSGSPHIAAASSHSPHHYGGGTSSPFESFKVEAVDNDDELSRDSSQLNAGVDQCASPSEDSANPSTQAVKKKMSLKEYLSRNKKVQESKKSTGEQHLDTAINPNISLLSKALTSFASSLPSLEKKPTTTASLDPAYTVERSIPEFEPVSPEEEEGSN
jgi:hypothetical protein